MSTSNNKLTTIADLANKIFELAVSMMTPDPVPDPVPDPEPVPDPDPEPVPDPDQSGLFDISQLRMVGSARFPKRSVEYSGAKIDYVPRSHSVYISGHSAQPISVAEYRLPDTVTIAESITDLPECTSIQAFSELPNRISGGSAEKIQRIGGLKVVGDVLVVSGYEYYDTTGQTYSHCVIEDRHVLATSPVTGWLAIDGPARKQCGYMIDLPMKWQEVFGGTHLVGKSSGTPIIGGQSVGPAAYVVNLADLGSVSPLPSRTLLEYGLSNPLYPGGDLKNETGQNKIWTHLSRVAGGFVWGNALVFIGASGGHTHGVEYKAKVRNPCGGKLPGGYSAHECDFDYHYWLYDLRTLGTGDPSSHQPYDHGELDRELLSFGQGVLEIGGVAFDAAEGKVYLTESGVDNKRPVIHVWNILERS
jgi:hypothetical protein